MTSGQIAFIYSGHYTPSPKASFLWMRFDPLFEVFPQDPFDSPANDDFLRCAQTSRLALRPAVPGPSQHFALDMVDSTHLEK